MWQRLEYNDSKTRRHMWTDGWIERDRHETRRTCHRWFAVILTAAVLHGGGCSRSSENPNQTESPVQLAIRLQSASSPHSRAEAARRLGISGDEAGTDALIAALGDASVEVRLAAVEALGQIRSERALEPLCRILTDDRQGRDVKTAAVRALPKLRDVRAVDALIQALPYAAFEAASALVSFGEAAVPALIAALRTAESRTAAAEALATIGTPAVSALAGIIADERNKYARLAAARALADIPDSRAAAALDEALRDDPDPELAAAAYRFIVRRGKPGTEAVLVEALQLYGALRMARDYIESGNPILAEKAAEWAAKRALPMQAVSGEGAGLRWGGGQPPDAELALFHFDESLAGAAGKLPVRSEGVHFVPGKWGAAAAVHKGGILLYPVPEILDFGTGTIELWISPRLHGSDPVYSRYNHALLLYHSPRGEQFLISGSTSGGFYAGVVIGKEFKGAGAGDISSWKPGEWHHLAFTYSTRRSLARLYLDGDVVSESSWSPPALDGGGEGFTVGSDPYGNWTGFAVDELRICRDELSPDLILSNAGRKKPFRPGEIRKSLLGSF